MKINPFPLIPFVLFLALGSIMQYYFKFLIQLLIPLCSIFFVGVVLSYLKNKKTYPKSSFGLFIFSFAFFLGSCLHYFHSDKNNPYHYINNSSTVQTLAFSGTITSELRSSKKNKKWVLQLEKINGKDVFGKLLIYNRKENKTKLLPGTQIMGRTTLSAIPTATNPYQFDYSEYLHNKNIYHQAFLNTTNFKIVSHKKTIAYYLYLFRKKCMAKFSNYNFSKEQLGVINALLFGQRKTLDKAIIEHYSSAGVIHILAISGLHVGILFFIFSLIFKPILYMKKGAIFHLFLVLISLWFFALVTGFSASVLRATILFSILGISRFLNLQKHTYNAIAFSALLLLVFNVNWLFDVGFQMSYAAVLGIVLLLPFFKYVHFSKNKIIRYVINLLLVSLAAQIGVLPLSLYYFHQFPTLFLVANVLVIPLVFLILSSGLITLTLSFFSVKIASLFAFILSCLINTMNNYIAYLADFKSFLLTNISFNLMLCIALYGVIIIGISALYKKTNQHIKYWLASIVFFQIAYLASKIQYNNSAFIVFDSKNTIIASRKKNQLTFFTEDTLVNNRIQNDYIRGTFSKEITIKTLPNVFDYKNDTFLLIDSLACFPTEITSANIILTGNPKLNLNRLIVQLSPKKIIATSNNYYNNIALWRKTCKKHQIPFFYTKDGFFKIE